MTVKADITSTLNGQTAELLLVEDSPDGTRKQQSRSLSGGTEALIFTSLDGGRDKRYTAKVIPSTTDVTQTSEIQFGAEIRIDPIPHRDSDATQKIRDGVEFNNGISAGEIGLGNNALVSGLLTAALNDGEVLADDGSVHESVQAAQDAASSYIFIGPGTFNEAVTIDTPGLEVVGSGYNTLINSDTSTTIDINESDVRVQDIRLTAPNSTNNYVIDMSRKGLRLDNVYIDGAGDRGVLTSQKAVITNCTISSTQSRGILSKDECVVSGCLLDNINGRAIQSGGQDTVISNNIILNTTGDGIRADTRGDDNIIIGNIVLGSTGDGVRSGGTDVIIANNRITSGGINDKGSALIEGNNTSGAN